MNRYLLLFAGAASAAGAAAATAIHGLWLAVAPLAVVLLAAAARRRAGKFEPIRVTVAFALAAGMLAGAAHPAVSLRLRARTMRVRCSVVGNASPSSSGGESYPCALDDGRTLAVYGQGNAPPPGERVVLRGRVGSFDVARNPGEPDEQSIQEQRGLFARVASAHVLRDEGPAPSTFAVTLARIHAWALGQLRLRLPEPYASILAGELWGERAALPPNLRTEFQQTGTVHILVTAG